MEYYAGIDVGGTNLKFGVFSGEGNLIEKWSVPTDFGNGGKNMWEQIHREIARHFSVKALKGIGIGIPGPVLENGYVEVCVNLNLRNFNPVTILRTYFSDAGDIKIAAANDANVAALGEQWKGSGQGYRSIGMVTLGTGVGGAVIIDGKLRYGANGLAGEIGHIRLNPEETELCTCGGRGCVDQIASATGIVRYAEKKLKDNNGNSILRTKGCLTAKTVIDAAKQGDRIAEDIVRYCMKYLAKALAAVVYVADPEAFIIGGGVSEAGDYLIKILQEQFEPYITLSGNRPTILKASLGNLAGIYGAARLVLN